MSKIHESYNLSFNTKNIRGRLEKDVDLTNANDYSYKALMYYLVQIQYPKNITDIILPYLDDALNGNVANNVDISMGSEDIEVDPVNTTINDNGKIEQLPTLDFRNILSEYLEFLQTPPLSGSRL